MYRLIRHLSTYPLGDAVDAVVRRRLEAVLGAGHAEDGLVAVGHLHQQLGQPAHQHLHLALLADAEHGRAATSAMRETGGWEIYRCRDFGRGTDTRQAHTDMHASTLTLCSARLAGLSTTSPRHYD